MYARRHTGRVPLLDLADAIDRSAAPLSVERLLALQPGAAARLHDPQLVAAVVAVTAASRELARRVEVDPGALDVLAHLDHRPPVDGENPERLAHWKQREYLRIAARDLLGRDDLLVTVEAITSLATDVVHQAVALTTPPSGGRLAVIGMGKLGGRELNYASDIDVLFVGEGDPGVLERWARRAMDVARKCFRVDANLRP